MKFMNKNMHEKMQRKSLTEHVLCIVGNKIAEMAMGPMCFFGFWYEPELPVEVIDQMLIEQ